MKVVLIVLLAAGQAWARGPEITPEEYSMYKDWLDGTEDPRLARFDDKVKLKKIARTLKVSPKTLSATIEKVKPFVATLKAESEKGIRESLEKTPLKPQILFIEVNIETAYPVAWVQWRCGDERDRDKEAAYVGWAVGDGAPVVKTLLLWCTNEIKTKLFSAKMGRAAFERINQSSIERFASSRYIRLFEEVKRGPHK